MTKHTLNQLNQFYRNAAVIRFNDQKLIFISFRNNCRQDNLPSHFFFFFSSLSLTLKVLTYPLNLDNTETNAPIVLPEYPIDYLDLVFVSIEFEMTILLTSTSQVFSGAFAP